MRIFSTGSRRPFRTARSRLFAPTRSRACSLAAGPRESAGVSGPKGPNKPRIREEMSSPAGQVSEMADWTRTLRPWFARRHLTFHNCRSFNQDRDRHQPAP